VLLGSVGLIDTDIIRREMQEFIKAEKLWASLATCLEVVKDRRCENLTPT
jgi:hypothetical protein